MAFNQTWLKSRRTRIVSVLREMESQVPMVELKVNESTTRPHLKSWIYERAGMLLNKMIDSTCTIYNAGPQFSRGLNSLVEKEILQMVSHCRNREIETGRGIVTDGGNPSHESLRDRFHDEDADKIRLIVQETRLNLLQDILAHPLMMPSSQEFNYYNPSKSKGTISGHLKKLVDADVLMRVSLPQGEQKRDLPNTFYTLSEAGYELLNRHQLLLPQINELREELDRTEKPEELVELEDAPRPTIDVEYDHPLQGDGRSIIDPKTLDRRKDNPSDVQHADSGDGQEFGSDCRQEINKKIADPT